VGLVWVVAPSSALAAAPELDTGGLTDCPSAAELRRAIATQLGRDDFASDASPRIAVRVRRSAAGGLFAEISIARDVARDGGAGGPIASRVIEGSSCVELVRASALTVALALDSEERATDERAPPPSTTTTTPAAPPPDALEGGAGAGAIEARRDRAVVVASGMSAVGLLPRAGIGVGLHARVRASGPVWISARGFYLPEARMPDERFGMTLGAGGLGVCVEPLGSGRVAAVGCAHALAGSLAVTGATVGMASSTRELFGGASLSAGARARVAGSLTVEGSAEATVPFAHPSFVTDICPPTGFQQPFAALALLIGAGVSIP